MGMLYMYESCKSQRGFQTTALLYSEQFNIPTAKIQPDVLCKNRLCLSIQGLASSSTRGKCHFAFESTRLQITACTHNVLQVQTMNISFLAHHKFYLI
jgi:hypothetical protein